MMKEINIKDVIAQAEKDWRTELENKFKVARIRREEIDEIVMEKFISELISSYTKDLLQAFIDDLGSNPNEDGSQSPNIQHWIEQKQIQLKSFLPIKQ
jgi:hypothetical protein